MLQCFFARMYQNDIEWAPSSFWQFLCQLTFPATSGFAAIAEQPPDDGRDSVDIVTYAYDPSAPFRLAKRALLEIKRAGYPRDKLIAQTLRYALKAMARYEDPYILALSIHNSEFMPWVLWRNTDKLDPFFPDWPHFISIHDIKGELFFNFATAIQNPENLDQCREIPEPIWAAITAAHLPGPSSSEPQPQAEPQWEGEEEPDEGRLEQETLGIKVKIHEEKHLIRQTVYYFRDIERKRVETSRDDWQREDHRQYRYKKDRRYWSTQRPS